MGDSGNNNTPAPPDYAKLYQQGLDVYLRNLPRMLDTEAEYRRTTDPQRIADQQALQDQYGPTMYRQQLDALNALDPEGRALRGGLAGVLSGQLEHGGNVNPQTASAYDLLGQQVNADLAAGYGLTPDLERQLTTQIRGAQAARGNDLGNSAISAEGLFKGQAALDLHQRRLQNAGSYLSTNDPTRMAQQQSIQNVGNFLNGPTPMSQLLAVQGVQPDRSMAYVNPSAGSSGVNFGLSNYQNLLAGQQLQQNNNPWVSALSGAGAGAAAGSAAGPYGALAGAAVGGTLGYFGSDERLKEDIREIGKTKGGIPLIRFKFIGRPKMFIGVRAQDVQKVRPDAVRVGQSGFLEVNYGKLDIPYVELGAN